MTTTHVVGLDLSLTDTGMVVLMRGSKWVPIFADSFKTKAEEPEIERKCYIVNSVIQTIIDLKLLPANTLICIEGYAISRNQGKLFTRAEIIGTIKHLLSIMGYVSFTVSPTSAKEFMGNGKFDKDDMKREAKRNFGFVHRNHNVVDAFIMARYLIANRDGRALPLEQIPSSPWPTYLQLPITKQVPKKLLIPSLTKKVTGANLTKAAG